MAFSLLELGFGITALLQGVACHGIVALRQNGRMDAEGWIATMRVLGFVFVAIGAFFIVGLFAGGIYPSLAAIVAALLVSIAFQLQGKPLEVAA